MASEDPRTNKTILDCQDVETAIDKVMVRVIRLMHKVKFYHLYFGDWRLVIRIGDIINRHICSLIHVSFTTDDFGQYISNDGNYKLNKFKF